MPSGRNGGGGAYYDHDSAASRYEREGARREAWSHGGSVDANRDYTEHNATARCEFDTDFTTHESQRHRDARAGRFDEEYAEPSSAYESDAVRLCEQMAGVLRDRMKSADAAGRAIREARESLDPEAVMARARAEAEAWTHGKSKLASLKAAQQLSPLGVRAVIAERDELRFQLRNAAQLLNTVQFVCLFVCLCLCVCVPVCT